MKTRAEQRRSQLPIHGNLFERRSCSMLKRPNSMIPRQANWQDTEVKSPISPRGGKLLMPQLQSTRRPTCNSLLSSSSPPVHLL